MANAKGTIIHQWKIPHDYDALANGLDFIMLRTGDGLNQDTLLEQHYDNLIDKDVILGGFHIFRENIPGTTQATVAYNIMKDTAPGLMPFFAWDVEKSANVANTTSREYLFEAVSQIIWLTRYLPLIYSSEYLYEALTKVYNNVPPGLGRLQWWIADYSKFPPRLPEGVLYPFISQTQEYWRVPGISSNVTEEELFGTKAQLVEWLKNRFRQAQLFPGEVLTPGGEVDVEDRLVELENTVLTLQNQLAAAKLDTQEIVDWITSY